MLIDTHAHLYWESYKPDLEDVIQRSLENNVKTIINVGVDLETSKTAVEQLKTLNPLSVYASIGLHPHETDKYTTSELIEEPMNNLEKLYQENKEKVVAIGECGLDYFFRGGDSHVANAPRNDDPRVIARNESLTRFLPNDNEMTKQSQKNLYKAQVNLAKKLNLPVIIHCRDAWSEIFIDELQGIKGTFHSFTGTQEEALRVLNLGFYLSFNGIITYPKNENLRKIVKQTPLDKILTETDCPFLPPQQTRGQRNEPKFIPEIVKVIAEVKDVSFEEVASITFANAQKLFNLV